MAKEIEEYFIKRLQSYLLEYLQDFSQNNMAKFSLGISTNIVLKNLSIKKQALLNFKFPLYIIEGKINQITLNMPLNYKKQQPEMIIEGVELLVCSIQEANVFEQNKEHHQQGVENLKKHKLKLWEEQMAKYFEKLSPPNWIQKIVDGIYNNMSISIKQFSLRFFNRSMLGFETILRIKFDAYIKATDKDFKQTYNNDINCTYKLIEIKKLSITFRGNQNQQIPKKDDQFILTPIDVEMKYVINLNYEQLTQPTQSLSIAIKQPITIQLNKEQKIFLIKLNDLLQFQETIQDNFHLRPTKEIKYNYSEWWKYFINAVMQKQKSKKLDLGYSSKKLVLMKRYIELYKRKQTIILVPWLASWTMQDETKFKKCEDYLSLKDLLKYRGWAFQEIKIEAKRYYNSSKDGQHNQSVKPLLEIWTKTINNSNSFKDHSKRNEDIPIELEDDEKINLYEILERDKTNVLSSYLKGENNHPDQVKMQFTLEIHSIILLILEYRQISYVKYTPENTKIFQFCQCRYHIKLLKKSPFSRKKSRNSNYQNSIQQVQLDIQKQSNLDKSFHSAKEIDSFYEDIKDLQEDGSIVSLTSNSVEKENDSEIKQNSELAVNQKLILFISLIGIKIPLLIFQNGGIQTPQKSLKESQQIVVGDIKIIAPGMIPKIMEETEMSLSSQSPLFESKKPKKKKEQFLHNSQKKGVIKFNEFLNEILEISINKDSQQFLNSELCYQHLGEFLRQNSMMNIKSFLDDFERDKNGFQDFPPEQFKVYDKYFDDRPEQEDALFLHITKHQNNSEKKWEFIKSAALNSQDKEKNNVWMNCDNNLKHMFLQQSHNRIIEIIRKHLFVPFIEEYGEILLPICIQNMREKLTFPQSPPQNIKETDFYNLTISLNVQGQQSEYKIVSNTEIKKSISKANAQDTPQNQVRIFINYLSILLSTKSLSSLLCFVEEKKEQLDTEAYRVCKGDHKLLECIVKAKPLPKEIENKSKLKLSIEMNQKFKIRIVSDQIFNKVRTELKLQVNKFLIQTVNLKDLKEDKYVVNYFSGVSPERLGQFLQQQQYYQMLKVIIYSFKIQHKYFSIDYRILKEEQRVNTEKSSHSAKNLKEVQISPNNARQSQQQQQPFLKHSASLWNQFDHTQKSKGNTSNPSSSTNIKASIKFKGIKQTLLDTQIIVYKLDSIIKNHPLLTDQKLYIQIPHFYLNINDSFSCFIEVIMILNKRLSSQENQFDQKYSMTKDSLMKAELLVLQNEHQKQKKDCKHCILKYRKSISLTNIFFGEIPDQKSQINIFSLLTFEQKMIYNKQQEPLIEQAKIANQLQKNYVDKKMPKGIIIQFLSTPKHNHNQSNTSLIVMPFLIITHDVGYFKDTLTLHCTETISQNDENSIARDSGYRLDEDHSKRTIFERNRSLRDFQSSGRQNQVHLEEIKEESDEKNYLIFIPSLKVEDPFKLWDKLDDKFVFYCRNEEQNMFNSDYDQKQMQQQAKGRRISDSVNSVSETAKKLNEKNHLYLLFYFHKPLRVNMLANIQEEYYQEKGSKKKLFCSIELVKAIFPNQFATYNIIMILKNIFTIKNISESAYNVINQDLLKLDSGKQVLKQNPMKLLDEIIVCAIIQKVLIQSDETEFKLSQLKAFIQINLMNSYIPSQQQKRTVQSVFGTKVTGLQLMKNRSSISYSPEECQIMRCDTIKFSFNQVSQIDIKIINVTKQKDELRLSVDDIQISIMSNLPKQRESLLQMPGKDSSTQRVTVALHVNLLFQNYHPLVKVQIEQAKIFVSQQKIQDLLIAINSFYLISIEESVSLKQHLQNYIFKQDLSAINSEEKNINLFMRQAKQNKKQLHFVIELEVDSLIIKLQEKDQDFFLFQLHQIYLKKRLNTELELSIQRIEMKPQTSTDQILKYPNLIEQIDNQIVVFKLENKVIYLENIKFYFIARYINELEAFKNRITQMLVKNMDELTDKYQKDFDMQLQIKQEEDFLKDKDSFNYKIQIKNSLIIIPESSIDNNIVMVDFSFAEITLQKSKIELRIPDISEDEESQTILDDQLLVDYKDRNQIDNGLFYIIKLEGEFTNVQVQYMISEQSQQGHVNQMLGQLLRAKNLIFNVDLPSFEQSCGLIPWKLKDQCKIKTHELSIALDFGKLLKIQNFLKKNASEKSPLFNFLSSSLQKINFELFFDDSQISLTRFAQAEPEKVSQLKEQAKVYNHQPRKSKTFSNQSNNISQGTSFN